MKIDFQETTDDPTNASTSIPNLVRATSMPDARNPPAQTRYENLMLAVAGKQCFSYYHHLNGDVDITGTDVSESLLDDARAKIRNLAIRQVQLPRF